MSSSSRSGGDRGDWPVRVYRLGAEPADDLGAVTSAEERLAMVWPLSLEAWDLTGLAFPTYARRDTPVSLRPAPAGGRAE